jgi:steroid delta-isomerase-like uncharacterized protein
LTIGVVDDGLGIGQSELSRPSLGATMTTTDDNRELLVRFLDAFERGDIATAATCFDPDQYYSHAYEADLAGTWAQQRANYRSGTWTDVHVERVTVWAEGDRVGHHSTFTGTHSGTFMGVPASGQRITMPILETWRVADGKIVEHWGGFFVSAKALERLRNNA